MRRAGGYAVIVSPDESYAQLDDKRARPQLIRSGTTEFDTVSCGHCGRIVHVGARQRPEDIGGLCKVCMRFECPDCVDKGCSPFEKRLEQAEAADRKRRMVASWV